MAPVANVEGRRRVTLRGAVSQGIGGFLSNIPAFLQVMAVPLLLSLAERLAYDALRDAGTPQIAASALWAVARAPVWTLFGFAWLGFHLGPGSAKRLWLPLWSRTHWHFLLCALLAMTLPNFAISQLTTQLMIRHWPEFYWSFSDTLRWLVVFTTYYVYCRFGLAFCAIVSGDRTGTIETLLWSWRLSGRAAAIMTLVLVPVLV